MLQVRAIDHLLLWGHQDQLYSYMVVLAQTACLQPGTWCRGESGTGEKRKPNPSPRRDSLSFFHLALLQHTVERVIPTTGALDASLYVSSAQGGSADLSLACARPQGVRSSWMRLRRTVDSAWAGFGLACDRDRRVTLHRSREPEAESTESYTATVRVHQGNPTPQSPNPRVNKPSRRRRRRRSPATCSGASAEVQSLVPCLHRYEYVAIYCTSRATPS